MAKSRIRKGGHRERPKRIRKTKEERLRRQENGPKQIPKTIDNQRLPDPTYLEDNDPDILDDINTDSLAAFFNLEKQAKVVLTTSPRAHTKTMKFCRQFKRCLPDAIYRTRHSYSIKGMVKAANERGFTHLFIVQEHLRRPNGLYLVALPEGPTAYFRLSSVRFVEQLRNPAGFSKHKPEIILNNFRTRLGLSIQRLLCTLFHFDPDFKGRRVVTFHNQRDYIFFRHHR